MDDRSRHRWALFFFAAAAFNFCMGGPIFFASAWSYAIAYVGIPNADVLRFWGDFGFAVLLIGVGYAIVGFDVTRNRGLVWLGIFAKAFDVVALSLRWSQGLAHPIVLVPAAIDGLFLIFFAVFLVRTRR